jgi:hypothetical protein
LNLHPFYVAFSKKRFSPRMVLIYEDGIKGSFCNSWSPFDLYSQQVYNIESKKEFQHQELFSLKKKNGK